MMDNQSTEQETVFCMEDCNNEDCPKNKYRVIICRPHYFAYLKNTEYCPLNKLNNLKKQEKTS